MGFYNHVRGILAVERAVARDLGASAMRRPRGRSLDALLILPLVGVIVGAVAVFKALGPSEAIAYDSQVDTPILTARRLPQAVSGGVGQMLLDEQAADVVATSPPNSCIALPSSIADAGMAQAPRVFGSGGGLVPASLVKLLVTDAALATFQPDHRFTTTVAVPEPPNDGGTVAELYLIGGGDPYLSTEKWVEFVELPEARASYTRLEELADLVVAAGVTRVSGSVIGDSSYFNAPLEEDAGYTAPGPGSALIVDEGVVQLPDDENRSRFAPTRTAAATGQAALVFAELLEERGVQVDGGSKVGVHPDGVRTVAELQSATVEELVTTINTFSSSHGAQMLVRHLGLATAGTGTVEAGIAAVVEHLTRSGLPMDNVVLADATGLSENNRVTCRLIFELLRNAGPDSVLARIPVGQRNHRHGGSTIHESRDTGTGAGQNRHAQSEPCPRRIRHVVGRRPSHPLCVHHQPGWPRLRHLRSTRPPHPGGSVGGSCSAAVSA